MKTLTALLCVLLAAAPAAAAGAPITIGETLKLQARLLGEERTILVSTPANYGRGTERYAVLYMTDGDAHLTHTRGTVDFLSRNGLMPNLIIVGVTNTARTRDLTPTQGFMERGGGLRQAIPGSGGADRFLDFFERDLIPYIESQYRTLPYRIFAGHSFGGLFALHTLATRPALFNATLAASPSLNWDGGYPLQKLEAFLKDKKSYRHALFVSMAEGEEAGLRPRPFDRLGGILKGAKVADFAWETKLMQDEDHGSVVLRSHYWGLRKVFEGWRLPVDPRTGAFAGTLEDLKAHYGQLGVRMGLPVLPAEQAVNQFGYQLLGQKQMEKALEAFRLNTELYPGSANVHDSLGEALEGAGRLVEAQASYQKAVERAEQARDGLLGTFLRNRDRVTEALKKTRP